MILLSVFESFLQMCPEFIDAWTAKYKKERKSTAKVMHYILLMLWVHMNASTYHSRWANLLHWAATGCCCNSASAWLNWRGWFRVDEGDGERESEMDNDDSLICLHMTQLFPIFSIHVFPWVQSRVRLRVMWCCSEYSIFNYTRHHYCCQKLWSQQLICPPLFFLFYRNWRENQGNFVPIKFLSIYYFIYYLYYLMLFFKASQLNF